MDPSCLPINTIYNVSEIHILEFLIPSLKVLNVNCKGKIKRFAGSHHRVLGISGMLPLENLLEFFSVLSHRNNVRDVLFLKKWEHIVWVKTPIKTEYLNIHFCIVDDSQEFPDVLDLWHSFLYREYCEGRSLAFYCDVKLNIWVKCRCGILHFTLDDEVFVRVNNLIVIGIIGEIYDKMIRFSGNKDLIVWIGENLWF